MEGLPGYGKSPARCRRQKLLSIAGNELGYRCTRIAWSEASGIITQKENPAPQRTRATGAVVMSFKSSPSTAKRVGRHRWYADSLNLELRCCIYATLGLSFVHLDPASDFDMLSFDAG
jgi:hypothetical protein